MCTTTDADDPLIGHLRDEADRIEGQIDQRLAWPANAGRGAVSTPAHTVHWSYRFTWQEVERGRRYVIPLPIDGALSARRTALAELRRLIGGRSVIVEPAEPRIRYRAALNAYEVACALRVVAADS